MSILITNNTKCLNIKKRFDHPFSGAPVKNDNADGPGGVLPSHSVIFL